MSSTSQDPQVEMVHRLFLRHGGELRGFLRALVPDVNLADDLLHEVFLLATSKAATYEAGTNFFKWVKAIARLKVLEAARAKRTRSEILSPEIIEALCDDAPDMGLTEARLAAMRSCMKKLPRRASTLIDMRYRQECKPAEIARQIGWKAESVSVELSRARLSLRQCLRLKLGREE